MTSEDDNAGSGDRSEEWPSTDVLFSLLADRLTREVLSYLETQSATAVEFDDIVDGVVEQEVEAGFTSDPDERRDQIAIMLHHKQLPRLDDVAIVDYDPRTRTVRYWGDERLEAYLAQFD